MQKETGWETSGSPANSFTEKPSGAWSCSTVCTGVSGSWPARSAAANAKRVIMLSSFIHASMGGVFPFFRVRRRPDDAVG